ncbi:GumC family protein [Methylobacterium organophilum]|uniref:Lipopolysaccharide biosynthesis protein n=1 Tax=Methylobacterium organophilum TaxID=410 RepID=A0ABQ4T9F7_METOR|nr:GumC family protein [Methylobacterium organophilum]GJE27259.1 hypothetical protein LKMONMHP_2117 [Methylobacterium organophilum]
MPRSINLTTDPTPPAFARGGEGEGLALSQLARVLRRGWAFIAVPTLAVALGAGVFVQTVSPRYTGEAKLILESRDPAFARNAAERNEQNTPIDEQAVASQVQVVMSRDLAREAIRRLKLVGNPEFDPEASSPGPVKSFLMMLGIVAAPSERAAEDRILDTYLDHLLVYPVGKSRILAVEFKAKDAALAAEAANTVAEVYIASLAAAAVDTARYASTWLGTNVEALRKRVAEAEARVESYRASHGLIGAGSTGTQPLSAQQLSELSSQLSQARTIKADLGARVRMLKEMIKEGRAFEIPDVANNELIRRTIESRITLRSQLALESRTLLPAHPRIKELKAQLDDLETQIKAAAERIVRTLENDAKIAGARVESLQAAVDGQQTVVAQGNSSEVELRALEREAKVQREQLESYLARYREAAARDAGNASPADARIVSRAVVPELPSFPKKLPILAFATLLALLLSAGGVVARHLLTTPGGPGGGRRRLTESDLEAWEADETAPDRGRLAYPEPLPPTRRPDSPGFAPAFAPMPAAAEQTAASAETASHGSEAGSEAVAKVSQAVSRGSEAVSQAVAAAAAMLPIAPPTSQAPPRKPPPAAKTQPHVSAPDSAYELDALLARLDGVAVEAGHCLLVIETKPEREGGLFDVLSRTLAKRGSTLTLDLEGKAAGKRRPGLTDLVAGEAGFGDIIQALPGSRLHVVGRGILDPQVLVEEPQGLAIGFNALAQAYDWVVCRLRVADAQAGNALCTAVAACMDTVVIASNAAADDPGLVALYGLAEESGARQILVARDNIPAPAPRRSRSQPATAQQELPLRRSA